jgi:hypothetical protein
MWSYYTLSVSGNWRREYQGLARNIHTTCHCMYVKPHDSIRIDFAQSLLHSTVEPAYNDISLCDTSSTASGTLWNQLIPYC